MTIIVEDLLMWILYLVYIQAGIMVGVGIERKLKSKRNTESELKFGTKGRAIAGMGMSFGLQLYDVNYAFVWGIGVLVSTVWSVYPVVFVYIQKKIEDSNSFRLEFDEMKRIMEDKLGLKIEITKEEIKETQEDKRGQLLSDKIEEAKNGNEHDKEAEPSEPTVGILSKMTP